jgi:acetyl esterase
MTRDLVHPQVASVLRALEGRGDEPFDLAIARAGYLQAALDFGGAEEVVERVEDCTAEGGVHLRTYHPQAPPAQGCIVYLHGGGWILGDLDGIDRVCRALCNAAGAVVASVDYRLAPEHPFPHALDDALAGLDWALARHEQVIVAGDSAGGNLAAVAALQRRDRLAAQVLVYPALDPRCDSASYLRGAPGLTRDQMEACWAAYLAGSDPSSPDASPLHADVSGAPPALIAVAGQDVLRDDGIAYAEHLRAAGVAATVVEYEDMVHGFLRWGGVVDRAGELIRELGAYARARF